jgi:hypothetical protein
MPMHTPKEVSYWLEEIRLPLSLISGLNDLMEVNKNFQISAELKGNGKSVADSSFHNYDANQQGISMLHCF